MTGAGDGGFMLDPGEGLLPRLRVRLADLLAHVVVGQRPQHRHRLGGREDQIEAGDTLAFGGRAVCEEAGDFWL